MNAILIHGFQGHPMHGWRPWLKSELGKRGWNVLVPAMPSPNEPKVEEWVAAISDAVGSFGDDTILVGHSLGCIAILRYLGSGGNARGALLVAGFAGDLGAEFGVLKSFLEKPLDWKEVRKRCKKFVAIFSDNDPYVPLSQERLFREKLGAKTVVLHNRGHFSSSEGTVKLPEALAAVLEISR